MRTHRRHGFTLLEIMLALGVSAIALVAAIVAANAQQRAFYGGQKGRAAMNSARSALLFLERTLPSAGFGMDAPLALDLGWYVPATCPATMDPCTPDKTDDADEITFYARNGSYWVPDETDGEPKGRAWHLAAPVAGDEVVVKARPEDLFRRGQVLQMVCPGSPRWAYFTVHETASIPPLAAGGAPGNLTVELEPVVASDPFRRQDVAAANYCPNARLFLIDRYRIHVRPVDQGGGRVDPFLVLDTGTDNDLDGDVDQDDEVLLAEGIEAFQVSYVFADPALPEAGVVPGTAVAIRTGVAADRTVQALTRTTFPGVVGAGQFVYAPSSFYEPTLVPPLPAGSPRLTNHQANVRTVRFALVARSPEPDPGASANLVWTAGSPLFRMNQDARPGWVPEDGGYQRTVVETSVNLPNMTVRAMSYF